MTPEEILYAAADVVKFDNCDTIWWRSYGEGEMEGYEPGRLYVFAQCSDFFGWACADVEPILTEADVDLLRKCNEECQEAEGTTYPMWTTYLYAARRRDAEPASFMMGTGKHAMPEKVQNLFKQVAAT